MDDFMGVNGIQPLMVATGGMVLAVGSLALVWWNERKQRQMGVEVVNMQKRLYSIQAVRASMGRLIRETVHELVDKEKMSQDDADKVCEALAFKLGEWELHPKPKPLPTPDPVTVKTAIRARLNGRGPIKIVQFPDLSFPKASSLAEELRALLAR